MNVKITFDCDVMYANLLMVTYEIITSQGCDYDWSSNAINTFPTLLDNILLNIPHYLKMFADYKDGDEHIDTIKMQIKNIERYLDEYIKNR
mgnify:FL=1